MLKIIGKLTLIAFLIELLIQIVVQSIKGLHEMNYTWAIVSNKLLWGLVLINSVLFLPLFGYWIRKCLGGGIFGMIVVGLLSPITFMAGTRVWFEMKATDMGTLLFHYLKISDPIGVILIGSVAAIGLICGWMTGNVKKK